MNTLYHLGECLTLIGFSVKHEIYDHQMKINYKTRSYPKLFTQHRREFQDYCINIHVGVMEVTNITIDDNGRTVYHGKIVTHPLNDPTLTPGTFCRSGGVETDLIGQRNSVWSVVGPITELIELSYAKKLAKDSPRTRHDTIDIILSRIQDIENRFS